MRAVDDSQHGGAERVLREAEMPGAGSATLPPLAESTPCTRVQQSATVPATVPPPQEDHQRRFQVLESSGKHGLAEARPPSIARPSDSLENGASAETAPVQLPANDTSRRALEV